MMSLTLLALAIILFGLLILVGGLVLLLATEQKKVGIALIILSLFFIACPVLVYVIVLLRMQGIL